MTGLDIVLTLDSTKPAPYWKQKKITCQRIQKVGATIAMYSTAQKKRRTLTTLDDAFPCS